MTKIIALRKTTKLSDEVKILIARIRFSTFLNLLQSSVHYVCWALVVLNRDNVNTTL
jgi:hypothetical protein